MDRDELCRRCLTALSKCADFSCDKSIVSLCESVWNIKAVEVPNPSTNELQRVRSHNILNMQESGSLERGDESYHSNMFNYDEGGRAALCEDNSRSDIKSFDKFENYLKQ